MDPKDLGQDCTPIDHLTGIETMNSLMAEAKGEGDPAVKARQQLVLLYYGASFRYILAILRDENAAQEIAQNFAIRFMQGDFVRHAKPERGRFRDYLKRSLHNLVIDYFRRSKGPQPLPDDSGAGGAQDPDSVGSDSEFLASLREELLARTWDALARFEQKSGTLYHTVLRYKTAHPEIRSAQIAAELGSQMNKTFTEAGMRQLLHRARDKFVDMLLDEATLLADSIREDRLEDLLIDLELIDYCRPALQKRTGGRST